jgi:hypothetical protein
MNRLKQYLRLSEIKPKYHKLEIPFYRPTKKRFNVNISEIELYRKNNVLYQIVGGSNSHHLIVYYLDHF